jgi:hypothetical protein
VVQSALMKNPPIPPDRIRLTIAVTPEVHAAFQRMADATGISLSRAMGDWLADTIEGAQLLTLQLEKARAAPKVAIREMQASLSGLHEEMGQLLDDIRTGKRQLPPGVAGRDARSAHGAAAPEAPRLVIRGGNSPGKTRTHQPKGAK